MERHVLVTRCKGEGGQGENHHHNNMPLLLLSGFPSSGKTKRATEIKEYLEIGKGKKVSIVSENDALGEVRAEKTG